MGPLRCEAAHVWKKEWREGGAVNIGERGHLSHGASTELRMAPEHRKRGGGTRQGCGRGRLSLAAVSGVISPTIESN